MHSTRVLLTNFAFLDNKCLFLMIKTSPFNGYIPKVPYSIIYVNKSEIEKALNTYTLIAESELRVLKNIESNKASQNFIISIV